VLHWQLQRVTRPGGQADNEPSTVYSPRRQVWTTRLGSHTRVVLVVEDPAPPAEISSQRWA